MSTDIVPGRVTLGKMIPGTVTPDGIARITAALWFHADHADEWATVSVGDAVELTYLPTGAVYRLHVALAADPLPAARAAYCAALETLWATTDRNNAAWVAHTNGEDVSDAAWQQAADAEEAASSAERDAFDAWRSAWRAQNGWR